PGPKAIPARSKTSFGSRIRIGWPSGPARELAGWEEDMGEKKKDAGTRKVCKTIPSASGSGSVVPTTGAGAGSGRSISNESQRASSRSIWARSQDGKEKGTARAAKTD